MLLHQVWKALLFQWHISRKSFDAFPIVKHRGPIFCFWHVFCNSGDAEKKYWSFLQNNQKNHRDNFKNNRGRYGSCSRFDFISLVTWMLVSFNNLINLSIIYRGGRNNRGGGGRFGGKHSRSRDNNDWGNRRNKAQKFAAWWNLTSTASFNQDASNFVLFNLSYYIVKLALMWFC